jgi:hypothetical protein
MEESQTDKVVAIVSVYLSNQIKDDDDLRDQNMYVSRLEKLCHAVVVSKGGQVTPVPAAMGMGDAFKLDIPVDEITCVKQLVCQAKEDESLRLCVGLGHDIVEAKYALEHAMLEGPCSIVVYHPDMEPKEEVKKSEPEREKALQILQTIKQNMQVFEKMKQENPQMYSHVLETLKGLVQAVGSKKGHADKINNTGDNIQDLIDNVQSGYEDDDQDAAQEAVDALPKPDAVPQQPQPAEEQQPQVGLNKQLLAAALRQGGKTDDSRPDFSDSEDPEFMEALYDVIMSGDTSA